MQGTRGRICNTCLKAKRPRLQPYLASSHGARTIYRSSPLWNEQNTRDQNGDASTKEEGAMSRRLSEMTQEMIRSEGKRGRKAMEDAGFSEELRKQLEDKIAKTAFRAENQQAFSVAEAPVCIF